MLYDSGQHTDFLLNYRIGEQRMLRLACLYAQSRQNNRFSHMREVWKLRKDQTKKKTCKPLARWIRKHGRVK